MQDKLTELEKKYRIDWREYEIGEIFEINSSKKIYHANNVKIHKSQIENSFPYIVRSTVNNGLRGYIEEPKEFLNEGNTLSFAQDTFSVFYQKEPYFTGNKVKILVPKSFVKFNEKLQMVFVSAFQKALSDDTWGKGSTVDTIAETKIRLPTINNKIAFEYIEEFVNTLEAERLATLEAERLATLEAYLLATGLKNTELTSEEHSALDKLGGAGSVNWYEFRNDELFDVSPSKSYSGFNDDKILVKNGKTPYVSNQSQDNGYIGWSNLEPLNEENVITLSDTWQSERTIFYQPKAFIGKSHLQVMSPLMKEFDTYSAMFIISSFRKSILKINYDYGTKFNRTKIKATKIQLPVKEDGSLDFEFMTTLIKAIQKVVIKNVVKYLDNRIALTDKVIKELH